jgi:uncharacterized protein (DUF2267 family)
MEYERFIATVREGAGLSTREAERVACATLQTLSERITPGEVKDPCGAAARAASALLRGGRPPPSASTSKSPCAGSTGVPRSNEPDAERDARAVFAALFDAGGPGEFADLSAQLPPEYAPLMAAPAG